MSQSVQHYQTSFVVKGGSQSGENKLYQAQYVIHEWIKSHELKRYRERRRDKSSSFLLNSGDFFRRAKYQSKYSWCKTNYFISDRGKAWVVEYTHRDNEVRDVTWVTEIGLRSYVADDSLVVSVKLSYKVPAEIALAGKQYQPRVSIPWCVQAMIESFEGCKFYSGEREVTEGIADTLTVDAPERAAQLQSYINDDGRKLAIVLLVGETPEIRREAEFLSKNLFGKALVYIVSYKHEVIGEFRGLKLEFNTCLFIPSFIVHDRDLAFNLCYRIEDKDKDAKHDAIFRGWLGYQPIYENGGVSSLVDIERLIRLHLLDKFEEKFLSQVPKEEYERVKSELHDLSGLFTISEEENKSLRDEKKHLEEVKDTLELQKMDLEDKNRDLHNQHQAELLAQDQKYKGQLRKRMEGRSLPRSLPLTLEALRSWSELLDNLIFSEKAWEGMERRKGEDFIKTAWDMLWCLNTIIYNFYSGEASGSPKTIIESQTGYQYSSTESDMTRNRDDWANERTAFVAGRSYKCFKHLKKGVGASSAMRVYFDYAPEISKVVVAHVGEHLTTKGTSRT